KVINLGFSFLPRDEPPDHDVVSCIWERTFQYIGKEVLVVCPAGNQDSALRRYPAALPMKNPVLYGNVIGVGSIDDPGVVSVPSPGYTLVKSKEFTNHGVGGDKWVKCSAVGSNVISSFLDVDMPLEDCDDASSRDFTANAWAVWNGTSFATP